MVGYSISTNTINVLLDEECHVIPRSSAQKETITKLLDDPRIQTDRDMQKKLRNALDKAKAIEEESDGNVRVVGNKVLYRGQEWDTMITRKILEFMTNGDPVQPLMKFMDRMMDNLSMEVIKHLYPFLDHYHFQITPEGYFIGYKGVRDDYYDVYSHSVWNGTGAVPPSKKRNEVDDNPSASCSFGYHIGTLEYAKGWGARVMRVLVDPKDCVMVPDHNCHKLRVTQYRVLEEVDPGYITTRGVSPMSESVGRVSSKPETADEALQMLSLNEKEDLLTQMSYYTMDEEFIDFLECLDNAELTVLHDELLDELE